MQEGLRTSPAEEFPELAFVTGRSRVSSVLSVFAPVILISDDDSGLIEIYGCADARRVKNTIETVVLALRGVVPYRS